MTNIKGVFVAMRALLYFLCAFLCLVFSGRISPWIPIITLLYWFLRGTYGRPRDSTGYITTTFYQIANASIVCANAIVLIGAIHSVTEGQFYQKMIASIPNYWGSHQHILGYPAEAFVLTCTILLPVSAMVFSGGAITFVVKCEWYASWKFKKAKSRFFRY